MTSHFRRRKEKLCLVWLCWLCTCSSFPLCFFSAMCTVDTSTRPLVCETPNRCVTFTNAQLPPQPIEHMTGPTTAKNGRFLFLSFLTILFFTFCRCFAPFWAIFIFWFPAFVVSVMMHASNCEFWHFRDETLWSDSFQVGKTFAEKYFD